MLTAATRLRSTPLSIVLYLLVTSTLLTVGLPIPRQEHGQESELIAGEDFLSMLMSRTTFNGNNVQQQLSNEDHNDTTSKTDLPSKPPQNVIIKGKDTSFDIEPTTRTLPLETNNNNDILDAPLTSASVKQDKSEGTIISVRVSSTVGHSMINKHVYTSEEKNIEIENTTIKPADVETITTEYQTSLANKINLIKDSEERKNQVAINAIEVGTTEDAQSITTDFGVKNTESINIFEEADEGISGVKDDGGDQIAIPSEDTPSLIAEANKSDFSVDEAEPISRDYNPVPSPHPYETKPYQSSVIYHNENNNNRARSVSYSTVIQTIPNTDKLWNPLNNGNPASNAQNLTAGQQSNIQNNNKNIPNILPNPMTNLQNRQRHRGHVNSAAETKDYYVTAKYTPSDYNDSTNKQDETSSRRYYSPEPTERNWGVPELNYHEPSKPYTPIVYAQPEQNYEVDEAVSVETNGRAHGVQPAPHSQHPNNDNVNKSTKKDDNQKVGYVVEGRNYRKYRVEERTSDGFIVGEYGVVRHDDGSLRGVRYTADGTISPRLIYDALMKFLSL